MASNSDRSRVAALNSSGETWLKQATQIMGIYLGDLKEMPIMDDRDRDGGGLRAAVELTLTDLQAIDRIQALIGLARDVPTSMIKELGEGWLRKQLDTALADESGGG